LALKVFFCRDRNNPIGAIVQGHTNLTEIKLAAELLWRVGVKPEQVALGYGFYGRSFELSNPSCSTPGCPFKGGAREGPCSKTSGILMYYEIEAILKQVPNLKPVWDKTAAVKYLVFDKNQWISYDDKDTFEQKIEWANSVGFGGALIWASDTDDDKFSAMSGLMGKQVAHVDTSDEALEANSISIAQTHNALAGKDCELDKSGGCRSQSDLDNGHVRCPNGLAPIGWDKAGCKVSPWSYLATVMTGQADLLLFEYRTAASPFAARATFTLKTANVSIPSLLCVPDYMCSHGDIRQGEGAAVTATDSAIPASKRSMDPRGQYLLSTNFLLFHGLTYYQGRRVQGPERHE
jgi:hypothetical protein